MPSVFTRIIEGELPGRFVWKDESCVAFLSIRPLRPGHTLVVPRAEIDHWLDLDAAQLDHLFETAQAIGRGQMAGFKPAPIGAVPAGLQWPHCRSHVAPNLSVHYRDIRSHGLRPAAGRGARHERFDPQPPVAPLTQENIAVAAAAGIAYLTSKDGGAVQSVFAVGFCFGGSSSWNHSALQAGLNGAIGFYGRPEG